MGDETSRGPGDGSADGSGDGDDDRVAAQAAADVESAWAGFRSRLADRLAELADDEILSVEVETGVAADDLLGAEPYLQFKGWGGTMLRAEAVSNTFLDERFELTAEQEERLAATWAEPTDTSPNFHRDVERAHPDELAVACVTALRWVYGVLHPAFLRAEGLELDPAVPAPAPARSAGAAATPAQERGWVVEIPRGVEHLRQMVHATLAALLPAVDPDEDGDVPCRVGSSVVFVRVLEDRPAVELFAEIVLDVTQPERVSLEVELLNRGHTYARFTTHDDTVRMSRVLLAWPYVGQHLDIALTVMLSEADEIAETLAARLGGRRFLDEPAGAEPEPTAAEPEPASALPTPPAPRPARVTEQAHPGLLGLVELLHLGPVPSPVVAHLFDHSRQSLVGELVAVRTGQRDLDGHDPERVLSGLRRALRLVVEGEVPERRPRRVPPRPRSQQSSLIADDEAGECTLDLGSSA